jgi:proline iminopeptidase
VTHIPETERGDLFAAYHARLTSEDRATSLAAARAWNRWESSTSSLLVDEAGLEKTVDEDQSLAHARLEAHYFKHAAWLEEGQLLKKENIDRIREIPGKGNLVP